MTEHEAIAKAASKYADTLTAIADLQGEAGVASSPRRHNRLAHELQRQHLVLRTSAAGRQAISALMSDERPEVRIWAASHALFWDEARARQVLEAIRDDRGSGVRAVSAEYTLLGFDKGNLNMDWQPPKRR